MVVVLKTKVQCFRCRKEVDKSMARAIQTGTSINDKRYECSDCYRNAKREPLLAGLEKPAVKKKYYCLRCHYAFQSKIKSCPLCSKDDQITAGNISASDLI